MVTESYHLCDVRLDVYSRDDAMARIVKTARDGKKLEVHLCNSYTLSLLGDDLRLQGALLNGDMNLADGFFVSLLDRRQRARGPVRGPGLFQDVVRDGSEGGPPLRHYLFGGAPGIAERVAVRLQAMNRTVEIAGVETPPYRALSEEELVSLARRIEESGANIVWIGLGTPKQDYLVRDLGSLLSMPLIPVGAAFDFVSGAVKEAPPFLRRSGFEWAFRLSQEPRRLWRRYVFGGPRFVLLALRGWDGWRRDSSK